MNIKAIILDLDGTVLHSDKSISNYTLCVLERCKQQGILLIVATARSEAAAQRYLAQLNPDAVISNGGALVTYGGKTIFESIVFADVADALIDRLLHLPAFEEITVETKDGYYVSWETPSRGDYSHSIYHNFQTPLNQDAYKITVHLENDTGLNDVAIQYPDCGLISFSDSPWHRFASKTATKMAAIDQLSEHCNLSVQQIVAFGDDFNDEEMIRKCGIGVAMENAVNTTKEAADFICESNDNDGVARWLEKYVLSSTYYHGGMI